MVYTRRITRYANTSSPTPQEIIQCSNDGKVSRALSKLQIDAKPALGGASAVKSRDGNTIPGSPTSSLRRYTKGASADSSDRAISVDPVTRRTSPEPQGLRSTRHTSSARIPSCNESVMTAAYDTIFRTLEAGEPDSSTTPQPAEAQPAYWFLPDEIQISSRTQDTDPTTLLPLTQQPESRSVRRDDKDPAHSLATAGSARPTRLSRELRKLEIRANAALACRDPEVSEGIPDAIPSARPSPAARRPGASLSFSESRSPKSQYQISRRSRSHLRPEPDVRVSSGQRHSQASGFRHDETQGRRKSGRQRHYQLRRLVRDHSNPKPSTTSGKLFRDPPSMIYGGLLERYPTNPSPELVDHVLYLLADAAEEHGLARALQHKAERAILAQIREEHPDHRAARIESEMDMLKSWEALDHVRPALLAAISATDAGPDATLTV